MTRQRFIDTAKGIAIISLVYFHAADRMDIVSVNKYIGYQNNILYSYFLPLFFMISAVFLRKKMEHDNISVISFLKKATISYLQPFYALNIIFMIAGIIGQGELNMPRLVDMIKALFFMQSNNAFLPSGVLWFLFVLYMFSVSTYLLIGKLKLNIYIVFLISILLKILSPLLYANYYFAINKITIFYIYYMAGFILSDYVLNGRLLKSKISTFMLLICWIVLLHLSNVLHNSTYLYIFFYSVAGICGSLFVLGLSYFLFEIRENILIKIFNFCGEKSLLIYVFHVPSFLVSEKIIAMMNVSDMYAGFIIIFLSGIIMSLIAGFLLGYNVTLYKILLGRRPNNKCDQIVSSAHG